MSERDFADFYATSFPRVYACARAFCGDPEVAYESTQEAFARCYSRWRRLGGELWVEGWVTRTALNVTKKHFRALPSAPGRSEGTSPGPDGERVDLLAAVRALPERQRQAVLLYHLMDLPIAGVADLMHLSEGTVKAHLHKARATLRMALEADAWTS